MAFIIESSSNQAMIRVNVRESLSKADCLCIKMSLSQLLAARSKNKSLCLALNLNDISAQANLPLVAFFSQFAEVYHQWRKDFHLELLLVIDPTLMPAARYLSESLCVPMLYFATEEALDVYIDRRTGDTQTFRPDWAKNLARTQELED
jgi:hypothetical protein